MDHKEDLYASVEFAANINHRVKSGFSDLLFTSARLFAKESQAIEDSEKHLEWPQPNHKQNYSYYDNDTFVY